MTQLPVFGVSDDDVRGVSDDERATSMLGSLSSSKPVAVNRLDPAARRLPAALGQTDRQTDLVKNLVKSGPNIWL